MSRVLLAVFLLATLSAPIAGCKTMQTPEGLVKNRAAEDTNCPREDLQVHRDTSTHFTVIGCGKAAKYELNCRQTPSGQVSRDLSFCNVIPEPRGIEDVTPAR